jgi:hypothetical protein
MPEVCVETGPLSATAKELKRVLSHSIDPTMVVPPENNFSVVVGTHTPQAGAMLQLYTDLLQASKEGYPSNIELELPDKYERPNIRLAVDLEKAVQDGLLDRLKAVQAERSSMRP